MTEAWYQSFNVLKDKDKLCSRVMVTLDVSILIQKLSFRHSFKSLVLNSNFIIGLSLVSKILMTGPLCFKL